MNATMRGRILLVEDDPFTRKLFQGLLQGKPIELCVAANGAEARRQFREGDFNLVIMDHRLPDASGLDLVCEFRRQRPHQVALLITGYADVRDAMRAVREGLFDYLLKPFENLEELELMIEKALELDRAYREIGDLRRVLQAERASETLVGRSAAIVRVLDQVRQVAPLDTTVLISGESGTGKELVARLIHSLSPRAENRFVEINCGALPESLLESTLFGHEKGAFPGAARMVSGCFEQADGGTLFLDEIADMSAKLQASLLGVIQQRTFARLGSTQLRSADVRLVCATNKVLHEEVKSGRFREDLYYRINVVHIVIPPLRERRDDIALLAVHFLDRFNRQFAKAVGPFSAAALRHLEQFCWPGNVRQLEHFIERTVALKQGGLIDVTDLTELSETAASPEEALVLPSYDKAREGFDTDYFTRLLAVTSGNISEAARISGMTRQTIYVHMKRRGIVK